MKSKNWFSLSIGALVLAAALPATQALAQTKGGTLNMIVQPEPPVIVTAINQQGPTQFVAGKIYESLLTYSTDLKPQPGLAKSWEAAADGLTYTFHLQDNVKWHDGKPFTSEDVVFSLADMLPKTHARARVILNKFVESVHAPDAKTVVIKLKTPFPAFMLMFEPGFAPMMPKHLYAGTDYMTNPANQKPVGTGPFVFKEWKRGEYIKLARNPDYWKPGKPYLDELVFNVIPDAASRAVAFERGSVDVLRGGDVDNVDIKRLRGLPNVEYTTAGWEMFSPQAYLIFNMRKPPFDNLKVRQAVMAAMNRNMVVNNIFFGLGKVSTSPFVTTEMFYDKNMPPMPFDMKKARALIKESGINDGMSLTDSPGRHDREFHGAIAAACGNAALAAAVAHLWNLTQSSSVYRRMQDYFVDAKVWAVAHAEHQRILTAIVARDPIRARHAMHAHLLGILARLREDFGDVSHPRGDL